MDEDAQENLLAELLEDYHRRRALGEAVSAEDYRERAADLFPELLEVIEAESAIDGALEGPAEPALPRAFGAYTLLRELGRGAMGVVYEAVHRDLGRKVALKILRTGFDTQPVAIERFRREARACAQVRHDNIVQIYEAGEEEGRPYYAMALIEGRSLAELAREGALPDWRTLAGAAAGIADALHALHERGVVHRDVKPGNIIVEPSGRMVLADFGLARTMASESLTRSGEALGTPLYMSPEQLLGRSKDVDGRTDVYGLGATLYEVMAGRPVFRADNTQALVRMILDERPRPLRDLAPHVPRALDAIVRKALEKRRRDRYESAAAMRDDLLAFARGESVRGRPLNAVERSLRWAGRHALPVGVAAAVLVAAGLWFALKPPPPAALEIACIPRAAIRLNGTLRGTTPLRLEGLSPGEYQIEFLPPPAFASRRRTVALAEGQRMSIETLLRPKDPGDEEAILALAGQLGLESERWSASEPTRGSGEPGAGEGPRLFLLYPRGMVRPEDLDAFCVAIAPEFAAKGVLRFSAGDRTLWERAVDEDWPARLRERVPLPEAVRRALRPGLRITWGFHPARGAPVTAAFTLAEPGAAEAVEALARRLRDQPPAVVVQLRAQACLEQGLALAAYREARKAAAALDWAPQAYATMRAALRRMGLEGSPLWDELARIPAERPARSLKDLWK